MPQVACRPTTCVDRGAGAAEAVGRGRLFLAFFKPKSVTDGSKESPVLTDSSSGGGASSDIDVVSTGVVSRGEGGAGAGSLDDVVATGVVNRLGDCEREGIDMDGILSDAAEGSGPADRTLCSRSHLLRGIFFFLWMVFCPTLQTGVVPPIGRVVHAPIYCAG